MVAPTRLTPLQHQPVKAHDVGDAGGRELVATLAYIGDVALLVGEPNVLGEPSLAGSIVHLGQAHHYDAPALRHHRVSRLLRRAAGELGRGQGRVGLQRRALAVASRQPRPGGDE